MSSTMQKAVFVNQIGKDLALGERAVPKPGKEEILIKIHSTMRKRYFRGAQLTGLYDH